MGSNHVNSAPNAFSRAVADCFGVLPNFFCSAPAAPGLIEGLWAFARSAYLDSPLPPIFKERLFVHLSRFCEVRYCIVRHVGFLTGKGRPAGDATAEPHTLQQVLTLLRRPVPDAAALDAALGRLEAHGEAAEPPSPETRQETDLFDALTVIFLVPQLAARARDAVRAFTGDKCFEILAAFLAFVRTAHYWTETHPELAFEPDMLDCMEQHPELAALLLDTSEATKASATMQLRKALSDLGQAQEALHQSEALRNRMVASTQDCLKVLDARGQLVWLNGSAGEALGCDDPNILKGRFWPDLWPPERQDDVRAAVAAALAGEERRFSGWCPTLKGESRFWDVIVAPITGEGGAGERVLAVSRDMTTQRRSVEGLRASEERLRLAAAVAKLGLWDWNVRTGEIHWSDEHYRMEGYEVGAVVPSYETWAASIHPDDRAVTEQAVLDAQMNRREYVHEFRTLHPDGTVRWLSARGRFFYDEHGTPVRMVGAMLDTTKRRVLEDKQKVLVAELQHRTRNLLGVVRLMADKTMKRAADLADFRAGFNDRLAALARVQGLLSRLEDWDRITFDELIRSELSALNGDGDRVTLNGPKGVALRSSTVQTFALALHELITNALKYGAISQPSGRITVSWHLEQAWKDGRPWLHVDWRESGVRIPESSIPQGGSGRELIERALPYQLGARTNYVMGKDGVHCTIALPVSERQGVREKIDA